MEHDPWNYVYYILYLKKKGENELSGLEYFAWTQISSSKTGWVPIGNTIYIESDSGEQLKQLDDRMTSLEEFVKNISDSLKSIETVAKSLDEEKRDQNKSQSPKIALQPSNRGRNSTAGRK